MTQQLTFVATKGGQGCTVTALSAALVAARKGHRVLIRSWGTDLFAAAGSSEACAYQTVRFLHDVPLYGMKVDLAEDFEPSIAYDLVVNDLGTVRVPELMSGVNNRLVVVTRACYLALRQYVASGLSAEAAVLITEPGRALTAGDVQRCTGVTTFIELPYTPEVARAVDAGLLVSRLSRHIAEPLAPLVSSLPLPL